MSIDRTSPLKPVSTVQSRETSDAPVQKARQEKASTTTSTSVKLSDAQAKLMQPGTSDINMERVETLIHGGIQRQQMATVGIRHNNQLAGAFRTPAGIT